MKICEGFWGVVTTLEDTKVLQFNQNQKLDKTSSVICADIKNLILKMVVVKIILNYHLKKSQVTIRMYMI